MARKTEKKYKSGTGNKKEVQMEPLYVEYMRVELMTF